MYIIYIKDKLYKNQLWLKDYYDRIEKINNVYLKICIYTYMLG